MDAKEIILEYLQKMAGNDESFKQRFEDKEKNIDKCMEYIKSQATQSAIGGVACISDDDVFGWAAHYYQEKDIKIDNVKMYTSISHIERKQKAPKATCNKAMELDLFGGLL